MSIFIPAVTHPFRCTETRAWFRPIALRPCCPTLYSRLYGLRETPQQTATTGHDAPAPRHVPLFLDRHPGFKLIEVASALWLQSSTMVEAVHLLKRKRWIRKARTNANRLIVTLRLTARGQAMFQRVKATCTNSTVRSASRHSLTTLPEHDCPVILSP